ncbi:heterodisulfide reductase-related iron-sulfur binding cluster [Ignicoccus hospitalis]|uniref:Succinate dehydrogenase subunit C n=1 Tax=Ignicoccus hospitalis (strain KIN4/I / DSM 18386 / JCM 14125) TaxID=453591 RepID=A8A9K1_IGNH4|nr:heterodisulfide reductase-related iron-sulfur binding cluster [Ignicoccus hospitalis]ABU81603.1 succinate dehydrogenase subunit C [Ignicoccus hospitalis KIN4/I]HIH90201.1 hypothetical protein [Desulfurococcaceae archaeon]
MLCHYPGCSTRGIGEDMEIATRNVLKALGVEYKEIEGWVCCGTGVVEDASPLGTAVLVASNLSLAKEQGCSSVFTACGICAAQLMFWKGRMMKEEPLREEVKDLLESKHLKFNIDVKLLHILDLLLENFKEEHVKRPLYNLRVSLYPGCGAKKFYNFYQGKDVFKMMEEVVKRTGAEVARRVDTCCGFPLMTYDKKVATDLARKVVSESAGADVIVTLCPFCQYQLDTSQKGVPVWHLHQLVGYAMGLSEKELGLDKHVNKL